MRTINTLCAIAILVGGMLAVSSSSVSAALPCNLNAHIHSTEFADAEGRDIVAKPMKDTLAGHKPANRTGAVNVTSDDPGALRFNLVGAGENILRCLDYGQDEVLVVNATPRYRFAQFGVKDEIPEQPLISDLRETGVYAERVENPMKLVNGNYLIDFTARHNGLWMSGEMVFERYEGDLYLHSTYLTDVISINGERYEIIATEAGSSVDHLTVRDGDTISFGNELPESIRIAVTADDTGETICESRHLGKNSPGGAPRHSFLVRNMDPGAYTATITVNGDDVLDVRITVKP